ncbi:hypothetical protein ACVWXO_005835 [Bradyrhizobium sp. LM2.7]
MASTASDSLMRWEEATARAASSVKGPANTDNPRSVALSAAGSRS